MLVNDSCSHYRVSQNTHNHAMHSRCRYRVTQKQIIVDSYNTNS